MKSNVSKQPELDAIYARRFASTEARRNQVWQVLTRHFFQQWVRATDVVLDLGTGYCEFINNIMAAGKYALDLNPLTPQKAASDVKVITQDISETWHLPAESVNVVFTSNFFEHLSSKQELKHCLCEAYRVLKVKGLLIAMGPNIRCSYDVYWDFFDHALPLSDRSIVEGAELAGFRVERIIPRFLPFTMQRWFATHSFLIYCYLSIPLAWRVLGKQFLVVARKP